MSAWYSGDGRPQRVPAKSSTSSVDWLGTGNVLRNLYIYIYIHYIHISYEYIVEYIHVINIVYIYILLKLYIYRYYIYNIEI